MINPLSRSFVTTAVAALGLALGGCASPGGPETSSYHATPNQDVQSNMVTCDYIVIPGTQIVQPDGSTRVYSGEYAGSQAKPRDSYFAPTGMNVDGVHISGESLMENGCR